MPCSRPLKGYRSREVNPSGKRSIVFSAREGYNDLPVDLPCGQCIFCRIDRSRQWAIRLVHEAQMHEENSFITLTYDEDNLPLNGSLDKTHFQKFIKRLRAQKKNKNKKIRYFHCGEYGDSEGRPHFHAILFGYRFNDEKIIITDEGEKVKVSEELNRLWPNGFSTIGDVNFHTMAYVCRYVVKKITGKWEEPYYEGREPDYATQSRKPAIAKEWYKEFKKDLFPHGYCEVNGKKLKVPKFYMKQLEIEDSIKYLEIKCKAEVEGKRYKDDQTPKRLLEREIIATRRFNDRSRRNGI